MRVRLAALVALLGGAAACGMDDPCAPKGDACGGDPSGQWTVVDSCRDPAYQNPDPVTYYGQTENMARQPPPEPTSSDWCSYLLYDPAKGITQFTFPHDTLAIRTGHVSYQGLGTYAALLSTIGSGAVDISASCLTRFSVLFQCAPADSSGLPPGVRSVNDDLNAYSVSLGSPDQNIACSDDGSGGCFCSYDIASEPSGGGLSGRCSTQGSLLTHFAGIKLIPSQADVCVSGDTMTIWGHDRAAIWDQAGLRTVTLTRTPQPPATN
jgi:hypothetical protein